MADERAAAPAEGQRHVKANEPRAPAPTTELRGDVRGILSLQRAAGNAAVSALLHGSPALQRIPVAVGFSERLQQDPPPPPSGGTPGTTYQVLNAGQSNKFQLTRSGDTLTINVRIKLVSNPNRQPGVANPVPSGDQQAARDMCTSLSGPWNSGNLILLGDRRPPAAPAEPGAGAGSRAPAPVPGTTPPSGSSGPPGEVKLKTNFVATPVFDVNAGPDAFDAQVTFHNRAADPRPQRDSAGNIINDPTTGTPQGGHPIDSGNWYTGTGGYYGATTQVIYAHEYGHLLGIPDEYSQSNPDMHTVLSGVSAQAGQTNSLRRAMDRAGVRHLILQAIRPHLAPKISALADTVAAAFATQRTLLAQKLTAGMRRTWRDPALADALVAIVRDQFAGSPLQRSLRSVMVFEAAENMSYALIARAQVEDQLAPAAIRRLIDAAFSQAFAAAMNNGVVNLPYLNETGTRSQIDMRIDTIGVTDAQLGGTPALTAVADAAAGTPPAGPTPRGKVPPLGPPGTVLSALGGLAAEWKGRTDLMQAQLDTLKDKIEANARQSFTAAPLAPLSDNTVRGLYRALYDRLQAISAATARGMVTEFLDTDIKAKVRDQVARLADTISGVADTQLTVTAGGGTNLTPAPTPDPALMASAQSQFELLTKKPTSCSRRIRLVAAPRCGTRSTR